jgi:hypothetical protein
VDWVRPRSRKFLQRLAIGVVLIDASHKELSWIEEENDTIRFEVTGEVWRVFGRKSAE